MLHITGVGIDLGTTNTVVCYKTDKGIEDLTWNNSSHYLPSVVSYDYKKPIVGDVTGKIKASNMKRLIGKKDIKTRNGDMFGGEINKIGDGLSVTLKSTSNSTEKFSITPIDVERDILQHVINCLTDSLNVEVNDLGPITIGIPANFQHDERRATLEAARGAGIKNCFLLNEPTAAALDYCSEKNIPNGYYIVYDLGGGTFDTTLVLYSNNMNKKEFKIQGSKGIEFCGGVDLDNCMVRLMKKYIIKIIQDNPDGFFRKRPEVVNLDEKKIQEILMDKARELKEAISTKHSNCTCTMECNCIYSCDLTTVFKSITGLKCPLVDDEDSPLVFQCTRSEYKEEIRPDLEATTKKVEELLHSCKKPTGQPISIEDVNGVILVGGSSFLWCIPEFLKERFPKLEDSKIWKDISPLTCVAHGCCYYSLSNNLNILDNRSVLIEEVSSYSYGIAIAGGVTYNLIKKGSKIPAKVTQYFTTTKDNQEVINTAAYIGDSEYTSENRLIQHVQFSPISKQPKGVPKLEITYVIEISNLLEIQCNEIFDNGTKKSLGKQQLNLEF